MLHDSIYMKFQTHLRKKKNQNRGDRTDWKGQAGTFWGDANVLQRDGLALHRCKVTCQNSSNGSLLELYLMVWVLKCLGVICTNVCNLLHMHPPEKVGGGRGNLDRKRNSEAEMEFLKRVESRWWIQFFWLFYMSQILKKKSWKNLLKVKSATESKLPAY